MAPGAGYLGPGDRRRAAIEEITQLSVGLTAAGDLAGNRLLGTLVGLAYQLLDLLRSRPSGNSAVLSYELAEGAAVSRPSSDF